MTKATLASAWSVWSDFTLAAVNAYWVHDTSYKAPPHLRPQPSTISSATTSTTTTHQPEEQHIGAGADFSLGAVLGVTFFFYFIFCFLVLFFFLTVCLICFSSSNQILTRFLSPSPFLTTYHLFLLRLQQARTTFINLLQGPLGRIHLAIKNDPPPSPTLSRRSSWPTLVPAFVARVPPKIPYLWGCDLLMTVPDETQPSSQPW